MLTFVGHPLFRQLSAIAIGSALREQTAVGCRPSNDSQQHYTSGFGADDRGVQSL